MILDKFSTKCLEFSSLTEICENLFNNSDISLCLLRERNSSKVVCPQEAA